MTKKVDAYTARSSGPGFEIVGPDGVIAWTIDVYWATIIVAFLNRIEMEGLTALCGQPTPQH